LVALEINNFLCCSFFFSFFLTQQEQKQIPRVELEEIGPSIDFTIGRLREASEDLMKIATQVPKETKIRKEKNIEVDSFAVKGRVHMQRQDVSEMATKKMKAFKRKNEDSDQKTTKKSKVTKEKE
jgi:ribosome production factor 2